MFKIPLFWRVYTGFVVVTLLFTVIISLQIGRQVENNSLSEIESSLRIQSELLVHNYAPGFDLFPREQLQAEIIDLSRKTKSRITLIDSNGLVVADSKENPQLMDNHANRPEVLEANIKEVGKSIRYSQTLQKKMLYFSQKINADKGFIRVSVSLDDVERKVLASRNEIYIGASMSLLLCLLLGFYFSKRFSNPIEEMITSAEIIAKGDYSQRIKGDYESEIGRLSNALNRMADSYEKKVEELIEDKNKLATILSGMVEGVVAVDHNEKVIHLNEAAARLLNTSIKPSLGRSVWDIVRAPEIHAVLKGVLTEGDVKHQQAILSGVMSDRIIDVYGALIHVAGKGNGAVLVLHDVSELHRLERVRQDFVSNASHELKTPITVIRGIIETILDDKAMLEDVKLSFLSKAYGQTERLSSIVTDLMALSRLESSLDPAGKQNKETVAITSIVNHSIKELRLVAEKKGVKLYSELIDSSVSIAGDSKSLRQLFDNLIDNAIKYTNSGGEVSILQNVENGLVSFQIKDTGLGITVEDQQRIFERFYRVDKGRSRDLGGTGLGLAIVKHIVDQHNGTLELSSSYGEGSIFSVTFSVIS